MNAKEQENPMITRILLIVVVGLPCIAQDVSMNNISSAIPTQTIKPRTVEDEIFDLETRHNGISSIAVKGNVVINSKGKDTTLNAVAVTTGDKTRIRISFGEMMQIIDYSIREDRAKIYLPRKDVIFQGTKQDVMSLDSWFALLTSELCGHSLAFPNAWDANATQRRYIREKSTMVVFTMSDDNTVKILKKIVFQHHNSDMVISNVYKYNNNGDLIGIINFNDYKKVNDKLIPHKISFAVNSDTQITFNFSEMWINDSLDDSIFEIKLPQDVNTKILDVPELGKKDWLQ